MRAPAAPRPLLAPALPPAAAASPHEIALLRPVEPGHTAAELLTMVAVHQTSKFKQLDFHKGDSKQERKARGSPLARCARGFP